jgi:transitional endoplasmic reticulum ATPase
MNTILETNTTPAIWITNTVSGIDPAYLRRFDFVVNLKTPRAAVKQRIASRAFRDLPISESMVSQIVRHKAITPAHMSKVSKICERMGAATQHEVGYVANYVLNGDLKAVHEPPLEISRPRKRSSAKLPYRPDLINCDTNIEHLTTSLRPGSSVRICSFGPPGTGKTAWARHLAETLKRPLLVKRAADILDKYIGETEKNIAKIFKEATSTRSVLMLDEMDSFLPDRSNATRHWEVTQANQFLTAMEEYEGILVCSTNLKGRLDPATMRRFDFKINFDYLNPEQACEVALDLLEALKVKLSKESRGQLRIALTGYKLSHGDFAVLLRRYVAIKTKPGWEQVVEDLKTEASFRETESRPIGFLADL